MGIENRIANPRVSFGRARQAQIQRETFSRPRPQIEEPVAPAPSVTEWEPPVALEIGRVLGRLSGALGRNAVTFLALSVFAAMPDRIASHVLGVDTPMGSLASRLALALVTYGLQAATIRVALDDFQGERPGLARAFTAAAQNFIPVIGISILSALGIGVAGLFLVAPGLMLAVSWSVAVPVRVAENCPVIDCFRRSAALTKGCRWRILALFALFVVLLILLSLLMLPLWGLGTRDLVGFVADNWLLRLMATLIGSVGVAALYQELSLVKRGGVAEPSERLF